jgi:hypothetical protein
MRRKNRNQKRLDAARREREQVRREGEETQPMVRRLERRARDNHFAELVLSALRKRRA